MTESLSVVAEKAKRSHAAIMAPLGLLLVDSFVRSEAIVRANANQLERIKTALPSAFVAPEISDDILGHQSHIADQAIAAGGLASSVGLAARTSSLPELAAIGLGAQFASSVGDGLVVQEHMLSRLENQQLDVGPSAIIGAYIMKFCLDKRRDSDDSDVKRGWAAAAGAFAGAMTLGTSYLDRKNSTLDFTSHSVGLAIGALGSYLKGRREKASSYDSAAETLTA